MKVVVYNVRSFEKEFWALANAKQHDLTLISNGLNAETQNYARGKDAVVISVSDMLDESMLKIRVQKDWQSRPSGISTYGD